ncbi:MAG: hypothetical protein GY707_01850, partial [Desulfobacteraceae bacterium]|nr:hypothetical protein [Desulfobacteraceae bacterium]
MKFLWWQPKKSFLIQAAKNGAESELKILLEKNADVNEQDTEGTTALMAAISEGHINIVKTLIEKNADVNIKNNSGYTALAMAISSGHIDIIQVLLKNKADTKKRIGPYGATHLEFAANLGKVDIVKLFLKKENKINDTNVFLSAIYNGNLKMIKILLKVGVDVNAADKHGETALMKAVICCEHEIVKELVENGADVNAKAENGITALILGAKDDKTDTVKTLLH